MASRRATTPGVLRAEARSVRLRVEGVWEATRAGEDLDPEDVDAITASLVDLQWRIQHADLGRDGAPGLDALVQAQRDIEASAGTVTDLVAYFATV